MAKVQNSRIQHTNLSGGMSCFKRLSQHVKMGTRYEGNPYFWVTELSDAGMLLFTFVSLKWRVLLFIASADFQYYN